MKLSEAQTPAERLRWAREQKGIATAAAGADFVGASHSTYAGHENGNRNILPATAMQYARRLGVRWEWLLQGVGDPYRSSSEIPIVGVVGAGAEIFSIDDHAHGAGLDYIDRPPGTKENAIAVRVTGDSMHPVYRDGDVIVYDTEPIPPELAINREGIVRLRDGRSYIKVVLRGSKPGLFTLYSYNAPPLVDQEVEWVAPVKWVRRK